MNGYLLPSRVWFFGSWLRWGGFYPEWNLRLYRRDKGRWARQEVHERLEVEGSVGTPAGRCLYDHHSYVTRWNDYRARRTRCATPRPGPEHAGRGARRGARLAGALHAAWSLLFRYLFAWVFWTGPPDGTAARLEAAYTWKKYARLAELRAGQKGLIPPAQADLL